jgi:hypothetical protein
VVTRRQDTVRVGTGINSSNKRRERSDVAPPQLVKHADRRMATSNAGVVVGYCRDARLRRWKADLVGHDHGFTLEQRRRLDDAAAGGEAAGNSLLLVVGNDEGFGKATSYAAVQRSQVKPVKVVAPGVWSASAGWISDPLGNSTKTSTQLFYEHGGVSHWPGSDPFAREY